MCWQTWRIHVRTVLSPVDIDTSLSMVKYTVKAVTCALPQSDILCNVTDHLYIRVLCIEEDIACHYFPDPAVSLPYPVSIHIWYSALAHRL